MSIQQMLLTAGFAGAPQNQTGGVNRQFNPDGTNSGGAGTNFTPVNWMSVAPQAGVGFQYFITFTDTGLGSGTALIISNNGAAFPLSSSQFPAPSGGLGSRNFSYVITIVGGTVVASGTGNTNNII